MIRWVASVAVVLSLCQAAVTQPLLVQPQTFLRNQLAFSASELSSLEQGRVIVRLPKTTDSREVAAFAVMRLDVTGEFFLEKMRDIVNFKKSDNVLQIGKISDPPQLEDLAGLTLDPDEISAIRNCRVNKCDFKMSAQQIQRFQKEVSWSSPDQTAQVTRLLREMLIDYVRKYLKGGNAALGEYNDKPYKLRVGDELRTLITPMPYMYGYGSEFETYLENFPQSQPDHVESFIYWSKEKFGLKPVISLTHITVYKVSGTSGADILIASKGIYANHYFEGSLGFTAFVHSKSLQPSRTYLIYINRSKADALRGLFAGLKRTLISGSLRDGAKKNMEGIKQKLETAYRP